MTDKYHVNESGEPGKCSAQEGNCRFGGSSQEHFATAAEAREAYEKTMDSFAPALAASGGSGSGAKCQYCGKPVNGYNNLCDTCEQNTICEGCGEKMNDQGFCETC